MNFVLSKGDFTIGLLTWSGERWTFRYSEDFRNSDLRPLVQFPDRHRTYDSSSLWPFFELRLPGLKQPSIVRIIESEELDVNDKAALLARFGRRCVSNPFELKLA